MRYLGVILLGMAASACSVSERKYDKAFVDLDSLVNEQVNTLVRAKAQLEKKASMDGEESVTNFIPDSTQWAHELDIFRQLDQINKPTFKQVYTVEVKRDTQSNLQVLALRSNKPTAIPFINFYFFENPTNLKKMDAQFEENNTLFSSVRQLEMTFDDVDGKPVLTGYKVEGLQKMVLGDSVQYSIQSRVQTAH